MKNEMLVKNCFAAWQKRDWELMERSLADDFTFTSPYDNHIHKHEYKKICWDAVKEMDEYEIISIIGEGTEAFVRYKGRINGTKVQNTEHFIFEDEKIKEITVFFGRPED